MPGVPPPLSGLTLIDAFNTHTHSLAGACFRYKQLVNKTYFREVDYVIGSHFAISEINGALMHGPKFNK